MSLYTTDACDVGDYAQPNNDFALTLVPSEIPKYKADEVYTFGVSITCAITSV